MKYLRYATLLASSVALTLLCIGTASTLVEFLGFADALSGVYEDPSILLLAYYQMLGSMNLNYEWFANYGPLAVVGLLATLFVASIP